MILNMNLLNKGENVKATYLQFSLSEQINLLQILKSKDLVKSKQTREVTFILV